MRRLNDRTVKERMLERLEKTGVDADIVAEWLWEEFGKRVKPQWKHIKRAILSDKEITPQDLIMLYEEVGVNVDESDWLGDD